MFFKTRKQHKEKPKIERLYDKYKYILFAKAMSILNDIMLAEDAVSETFAKLPKFIDKIDEENEPRTISFLSIMCRNEAIDIWNKNKKERPADFIETALFEEEPIHESNPESIVINQAAYDTVMAAIESLKPIYKEVFMLHYVQGFTCRETAEFLKITPEAAEKRFQRAKKILREKLKEEDLL